MPAPLNQCRGSLEHSLVLPLAVNCASAYSKADRAYCPFTLHKRYAERHGVRLYYGTFAGIARVALCSHLCFYIRIPHHCRFNYPRLRLQLVFCLC